MCKEHLTEVLNKGVASMQARKVRLRSLSFLPSIWCVLSGGEQVEFCTTSKRHAEKFLEVVPPELRSFFDLVGYVPATNTNER